MQNAPKIVRERLEAATPVANHPDADVLTAFSERCLPELERAIVLEHLARCTECREIVALALPATESAQSAPSPAPSKWVAWPALRWGIAAAGIIVVASVGVLQYQRHTHSTMMAYRVTAPAVARTEARNQSDSMLAAEPGERDRASAPASAVPGTAIAKKIAAAPEALARNEGPAPVAPSARPGESATRVLANGPLQKNQWQQQNTGVNLQEVSPPPRPYAGRQASAEGAANTVVGGPVQAQNHPVPPSANPNAQDLESKVLFLGPTLGGSAEAVARAKPAGTLASKAKTPAGVPPVVQSTSGAVGSPQPPRIRWTIKSGGVLQRSLDQGRTWQDVNVNGSAATAGATFGLDGNFSSTNNDAVGYKQGESPVAFRAVAANGADVWAGGSRGMLYHSTDSGNHWTRVIPSSSGADLTGDVLALDFPNAQHGRISTSTSEIWITTDGGQTWQKQ